MGNPHNQHEVTEANKSTVAYLSSTGMTQAKVAAVLKISVDTLTKYYRHEYEHGNEMMVADLIPVCMTIAKDPDHKDSCKERHFLLERKGGFIKTEEKKHTGVLEITKIERTIIDPKKTDG